MRSLALCGAVLVCGCKDLVGNPALPAGTQNPEVYNTPSGALAFARGTENVFQRQVAIYAVTSGIMTDELTRNGNGSGVDSLDARRLLETDNPSANGDFRTGQDYQTIQQLRGQTRIARGAVEKYAPNASPAIRGKLFATEGYADLALAELFCSGVPLSTVDFEKDFTYLPGSTSAQIYEAAAQLFDSALALAADSPQVQTFARVGKGRALLGLGQYSQAAAAVAPVPDGSSYTLKVAFGDVSTYATEKMLESAKPADGEGLNGRRYLSDGDPRTQSRPDTIFVFGVPTPISSPVKYSQHDSSTFVVADWIEARLIEAEAALQAGDTDGWLQGLNHLRRTAPVNGVVGSLPDLEDPGTLDARVDTLFAERAAWLYLTGHRQGDLRRMVRQYGRRENTVYPTGVLPGFGAYGNNVSAPVPVGERVNPYFHGCFNHDA